MTYRTTIISLMIAAISISAIAQDKKQPRVFKANKAPNKIITTVEERPVPVPVPSSNTMIDWDYVNDLKNEAQSANSDCMAASETLSEQEQLAKKIECNNKNVTHKVNTHNFNNAIQTFPYQRGMVYQVITSVGRTTDIEFQPGEKPRTPVMLGNRNLYDISGAVSGDPKKPIYHLILKPKWENTVTDLKIYTNRRTYYLELVSMPSGKGYLSGVSWSGFAGSDYSVPFDFTGQGSTKPQSNTRIVKEEKVGFSFDPGTANFNYRVLVEEGDSPEWKPKRVIDNGRETYIEFPPGVTNIPAIYIETSEGKGITPQFRPHANGVVVSQLANVIVLRSGAEEDDNLEIVKIINRDHHG